MSIINQDLLSMYIRVIKQDKWKCLIYISVRGRSVRNHAIALVNRQIVDPATKDASSWFVDGTFRIVPRQGRVLNLRSSQVLNILADFNGSAIVVFTIIMTSRKVGLYRKVLELLKMKFPNFEPKQLMADYEGSLRKAIKEAFPRTRLYGCR